MNLREKIAIAQEEGATHAYGIGSGLLWMCKKDSEGEWLFRPLDVFGTQRPFSWFHNLDGADESNMFPIEEGLRRLDEFDRKQEAERTGQFTMF